MAMVGGWISCGLLAMALGRWLHPPNDSQVVWQAAIGAALSVIYAWRLDFRAPISERFAREIRVVSTLLGGWGAIFLVGEVLEDGLRSLAAAPLLAPFALMFALAHNSTDHPI